MGGYRRKLWGVCWCLLWIGIEVTIKLRAIQYCHAHLLRAVQDLEKEFPEEKEITENDYRKVF